MAMRRDDCIVQWRAADSGVDKNNGSNGHFLLFFRFNILHFIYAYYHNFSLFLLFNVLCEPRLPKQVDY